MKPPTFTLRGKKKFLWQIIFFFWSASCLKSHKLDVLLRVSTTLMTFHVCCGRCHRDTAQLWPELDLKIAFPAKIVCCFWSSFSQIPSKSSIASRAFLTFQHIPHDQVITQTLCSNTHIGLTNTQSHQSRVSPDFLCFRSVISAETHQESVCLHQRPVTYSWQLEYPTC